MLVSSELWLCGIFWLIMPVPAARSWLRYTDRTEGADSPFVVVVEIEGKKRSTSLQQEEKAAEQVYADSLMINLKVQKRETNILMTDRSHITCKTERHW